MTGPAAGKQCSCAAAQARAAADSTQGPLPGSSCGMPCTNKSSARSLIRWVLKRWCYSKAQARFAACSCSSAAGWDVPGLHALLCFGAGSSRQQGGYSGMHRFPAAAAGAWGLERHIWGAVPCPEQQACSDGSALGGYNCCLCLVPSLGRGGAAGPAPHSTHVPACITESDVPFVPHSGAPTQVLKLQKAKEKASK